VNRQGLKSLWRAPLAGLMQARQRTGRYRSISGSNQYVIPTNLRRMADRFGLNYLHCGSKEAIRIADPSPHNNCSHPQREVPMRAFSDSYVVRVLLAPSPQECGLGAVARRWHHVRTRLFDPYRPELHYMRGPGPKWREKHLRDAGS
jgi:hypothetical protein